MYFFACSVYLFYLIHDDYINKMINSYYLQLIPQKQNGVNFIQVSFSCDSGKNSQLHRKLQPIDFLVIETLSVKLP